jgi:hypothetical protein
MNFLHPVHYHLDYLEVDLQEGYFLIRLLGHQNYNHLLQNLHQKLQDLALIFTHP